MRKALFSMVLAVVVATTAPGCTSSEPPAPTIKAGETPVPAVLSSYCWTTRCADYPSPPDHLRSIGYKPAVVPGGSVLTVNFARRPAEPITSNQWTDNKATASSLAVPTEPGIYTYDIGARWKQGSAAYIFQVEVR